MRARTLLLSENLSVPSDRRVWQEAVSLSRAGLKVDVVCPQGTGRDHGSYEEREGIRIHRYPPHPAGESTLSYLREYSSAVWQIRRLVSRLASSHRFDVVHAANPPDLLLASVVSLKARGTRFIFDHHDLVPELYLSRYGRRGSVYLLTRAFERLSFGLADVVISPNETYRQIATSRGGRPPDQVFVVRNAPDLSRFKLRAAKEDLKRGRRHLIAYVGVMGPQDGVEYALRALAIIARKHSDWHATFAGEGDALPALRRLAADLSLVDHVEFTGWLEDDDILEILSTTDVCLSPEPKTPLNDASTMIKVAEYMAMARPVVAYDLAETRATAGDAAVYAEPNDPASFAACITSLLENEDRRRTLGTIGRERVERALAWEHSEKSLLAAYQQALVGHPSS